MELRDLAKRSIERSEAVMALLEQIADDLADLKETISKAALVINDGHEDEEWVSLRDWLDEQDKLLPQPSLVATVKIDVNAYSVGGPLRGIVERVAAPGLAEAEARGLPSIVDLDDLSAMIDRMPSIPALLFLVCHGVENKGWTVKVLESANGAPGKSLGAATF